MAEEVKVCYEGEFRYLDTAGNDLNTIEKKVELPAVVQAPLTEGGEAGSAGYYLNGTKIGEVRILFAESVEKAGYLDYLQKVFGFFLL